MPPRKSKKTKNNFPPNTQRYIIVALFIFIGVAAFLMERNSLLGSYLYKGLYYAFGEYYKWIFSPALILLGLLLIKDEELEIDFFRFFGLIIFYLTTTTFVGIFISDYGALFNIFGYIADIFGKNTGILANLLIFLTSLVIVFRFSPINFLRRLFIIPEKLAEIKDTFVGDGLPSIKLPKSEKVNKENKTETKAVKKLEKEKEKLEKMMQELKDEKAKLIKEKQPKQLKINQEESIDKKRKIQIFKKDSESKNQNPGKVEIQKGSIEKNNNGDFSNWILPEANLLDTPKNPGKVDTNEIRRKEIEIQEKLLQFKIEVEMEDYRVGPTVIQYRLKPKEGVKLQKIENLKKDLALALHAKSIRIQAPIPGLGVVGIEVPNSQRSIVYVKEAILSTEFNNPKLEIPIVIGKSINGEMIIGDLTKMPHLLVAGQTGSGKSVGMNGFLVSLLYKFSPSELKLIMVDPKMVELSVYNGIPHLLTPVITNADKALNSLKWCVAEMLRRYDLEKQLGARNIKEYNAKVKKEDRLPYIVMVIDELADLMMSGNKKEVENAIARIAQMARAVGIHLIIATQRPSVDVITGLIKANIPSRIAFTVSSQIDSRTILDKSGAEDLLGKGDMLYYPTGNLEPERVQGVLVETHEVEAIVKKLKLTVDPDMIKNLQISEIANGKSKFEGSIMENYDGDQEEDPEIIEKAIEIVKQTKKGSTSLIQRKLGLGYARAAKVLDILEELGVVGPSNGSKPRDVYVD